MVIWLFGPHSMPNLLAHLLWAIIDFLAETMEKTVYFCPISNPGCLIRK